MHIKSIYLNPTHILIIAIFLVLSQYTNCLHLSSAEDQQLNYLVDIQQGYAGQVKYLNQKLGRVQRDLASTSDLNTKISILEKAISEQRQTMFDLQRQLTPSSIQPFISCQIMTPQKQSQLAKTAKQLQTQINGLQKLINDLPPCDQTQGIINQINKLKILLVNAEDVINNNCQQMLLQQSTVYQTNIKSNKWILGDSLTMSQLQDSYVDRAMTYGNITNCPLATPFYASGRCINCDSDYYPIFDMSRQICVRCPEDQSLNLTIRQCQAMPRNSNYTYGQNYVLLPLKLLPLPDKNLTSCPELKPFFDGNVCVSCPLPYKYWNISQSKCLTCPNNQVFNLNSRTCVTRVYNKLTKLSGTNWVTNDGSVTRVLNQRVRILQINETTGNYQLCPDMQPYYDGLACVYCKDQFNLDTLKCSSPPENLQFDPNMRKYLMPEPQRKEMDPNAPNYITERQQIVDNANIPNCNVTHPYYDQISCIYCQDPFPIFNYDTNRCVVCQPIQFYNSTSRKCQTRLSIYVKGNEDRLLATPQRSIDQYKQLLYNQVLQNPDKIPKQCADPTQYAALSQCVPCSAAKGQYFNVYTFKCQICDGSIDPVTNICKQRQYYVTNLDANNLLIDNIQQQRTTLNSQVASNPRLSYCPLSAPYSYNNRTTCGTCPPETPYFNYSANVCMNCSVGTRYDPQAHKCRTIVYLTDYTQNVLVNPPKTLADYQAQQDITKANNITQMCPSTAPYTKNGQLCFNCIEPAPIFNASSGLCTKCPAYYQFVKDQNVCKKVYYLTNLQAQGLLQQDNYTVPNVKAQQDRIRAQNVNPYTDCPIENPYGQDIGCVNCINNNTYFNLKTLRCQACPNGTAYWPATRKCQPIKYIMNFQAGKIVQDQNHTIASVQASNQQLAQQGPVKPCPIGTPYLSPQGCIQCPQTKPFFYLATLSCEVCDNYKPENNTCPPKPIMYPNLTNYHWISSRPSDEIINNGLRLRQVPGANECEAFYHEQTKDCIVCPASQLYNYDTNKCEACPSGTSFDINVHSCVKQQPIGVHYTNIDSTQQRNLIYGGLTIGQLQGTQAQLKSQYPNSQYCPPETPYFDQYHCIMCPQYKNYFNLRYLLCQVCLQGQTYNPATHNCEDENGAAVWRKPSGELVYPYKFGH